MYFESECIFNQLAVGLFFCLEVSQQVKISISDREVTLTTITANTLNLYVSLPSFYYLDTSEYCQPRPVYKRRAYAAF